MGSQDLGREVLAAGKHHGPRILRTPFRCPRQVDQRHLASVEEFEGNVVVIPASPQDSHLSFPEHMATGKFPGQLSRKRLGQILRDGLPRLQPDQVRHESILLRRAREGRSSTPSGYSRRAAGHDSGGDDGFRKVPPITRVKRPLARKLLDDTVPPERYLSGLRRARTRPAITQNVREGVDPFAHPARLARRDGHLSGLNVFPGVGLHDGPERAEEGDHTLRGS